MGQFKPMVKMYTDEPSVILKLKKGGKVASKAAGQHEGFKSMASNNPKVFEGAESGVAPKKPSMAERRRAMNPNQYAKGGKVAHKQMGGAMPMQGAPSSAMPAMPVAPAALGRQALMAMPDAKRMARAAMIRKAMTGMKKGGSADHKMIEKLQKELHHHESLGMAQAHHKKHGGMAHHAHGGKVHRTSGHPEGSYEHHKAMAKHYADMCKEGGTPHMHKMCEHHKHMAKMCKGGSYAKGGAIDKAEIRTTIEGNAGKYAKTKMDTAKKDRAHGTGEVKEGKPAGYATGGAIPADTDKKVNKGQIKMKGTIEGNEKDYESTEMHTAKKDKAHGTGGIKESNAGGYAKGGKVPGLTNKTIEGGDWENRPANSAKAGIVNGTTGGVKEANAGGYKKGGAAKKHFATGGQVVDDGKAVKMPRHFVSRPVANSLQSGTFKKGGKVSKFDSGGSTGDSVIDRETSRMKAEKDAERADNESMRESILGAPRRAFNAVKSMFGSSDQSPPAGSITKTEKSVTVSPGKKRGGRA